MNRRRLLGLCGLCVSGAAGCLSGASRPGDEGSETETDEPTSTGTDERTSETTESPPEGGVVVEDIVVRKAVKYESVMGSGGVLAAKGEQYVVASVRTDRDLSPSSFAFLTDGNSWDPGLPHTVGAINLSVAGRTGGPLGRAFGSSDESYLAFAVPAPLSATDPRIRFEGDGTEWPLSARMRDRLEAPSPRFELESLTVPEAVSQGETLSLSLTATNVSDTDGRFLAAVYWPTALIADDDESHVVERTAAANDDVTASLEIDTAHTGYEAGPVTLSIRGHVSAQRDVELRDVSTASETE